MSETPDEIIERQGQMIVKQAEELQRMKGYVAELAEIADETARGEELNLKKTIKMTEGKIAHVNPLNLRQYIEEVIEEIKVERTQGFIKSGIDRSGCDFERPASCREMPRIYQNILAVTAKLEVEVVFGSERNGLDPKSALIKNSSNVFVQVKSPNRLVAWYNELVDEKGVADLSALVMSPNYSLLVDQFYCMRVREILADHTLAPVLWEVRSKMLR